ncbi:MAG: hypothetical protein KGN79_02365 [Acidobacteriota bacterium]|nr:hypothetical protein [Acidobacteriota bacterium]
MQVFAKASIGQVQYPGGTRSRTVKVTAFLCVVLLALLAFAQVTHMHRTSSDAEHCALCVVLHSAVPIAAAAAVVLFTKAAITVPVPKARRIARYWQTRLLNRPPPMACIAFFGAV